MDDQIEADRERSGDDKKVASLKKWFWVAVWIVSLILGLCIVIAILIYASYFLGYNSDPVLFVTGNLLNALIFAAIVAQALIYRKQWHIMKGQLVEMRVQAITSHYQYKITGVGLKAAHESAVNSQRAYVVAKIEDTGPYDEGCMLRLRIENGGNTPANNVSVYYSWELRQDPPWPMLSIEGPAEAPVEQALFETTFAKTVRLGVVAPNGGYYIVSTESPPVSLPYPFTSPEYKLWEAEGLRFYCWGTIVYQDIFDEERHTHFCFYQSQQKPYGYACEHGNKAY